MQEKGRFLEKFKKLFLIILFVFFSKASIANSEKLKLLNYNNDLKNSSINFIQTDGETLEEGVIYIGQERIKIDYIEPKKIDTLLQ